MKLWAFSLLSAVGALPFLIQPVLAGGILAEDGAGLATFAVIASLITCGEIAAAVSCPVYFGGHFRQSQAIATTFLLGALFSISAVDFSILSLTCWFLIGVTSGTLQYMGTTFAVSISNPVNASQIRLTVSLLVSGVTVVVSSLWVGSGYDTLRYVLSLTIVVSGIVVLVSLLVSGSAENAPRNAENAHEFPSYKGASVAFASITLFFMVLSPFFSTIPVLVKSQGFATTLFQLGVGKIMAVPILLCISSIPNLGRSNIYGVLCSIILALSVFTIVHFPSGMSFMLLEIGVNGSGAFLLGFYGMRMSVSQSKWLFLCAKFGSVLGLLSLTWMRDEFVHNSLPPVTAFVPIVLVIVCWLVSNRDKPQR